MAIYSNDELTKLYEQTYPSVYAIAYSIVKNEQDACDLAQDTYLTAFSGIEKLSDINKFDKWIVQIAANKCKDFLRKKKPDLFSQFDTEETDFESEIVDTSNTYSPDKVIDEKEVKGIVKDILYSLPEDQRLCVVLYYGQDLKISEIANALSVSENTVKSRLSYAKKKIKQQVEDYEKKGTKLYSISALAFLPLIRQAFSSGMFTASTPALNISSLGTAQGVKVAAKAASKFTAKKLIAGITATAVVTGGIAAAVLLKPKPDPMIWCGYGAENALTTKRFEITIDEMNDTNISGHLEISYLYNITEDIDFTGTGVKNDDEIIYMLNLETPLAVGTTIKYKYEQLEVTYDKSEDEFSFNQYYDVELERHTKEKPKVLFENENWSGIGKDGFYKANKTQNHQFVLNVYKMTEMDISGNLTVSYDGKIDHNSQFTGRGYEKKGVIYYEILLETPRTQKNILGESTLESFWLEYDVKKQTFEIPFGTHYSVVMEKE